MFVLEGRSWRNCRVSPSTARRFIPPVYMTDLEGALRGRLHPFGATSVNDRDLRIPALPEPK
jgi:hypothetical protein